MIRNKYGEKEVTIFKGVIGLIREGVDLHNVKASDIASMARIGKGTLYNYFKSKEEIIAKSVLYMLEVEFSDTLKVVNKASTFKEKCYAILDSMERGIDSKNSTINWIASNIKERKFRQHLTDDMKEMGELKTKIDKVVVDLAKDGVAEGVIREQTDIEYQLSVFKSAFLGYSNVLCSVFGKKDIEKEKAKRNAYKMLIKSLN